MGGFLFYLYSWVIVGACMFFIKTTLLKKIRLKTEIDVDEVMNSDDIEDIYDPYTYDRIFVTAVSIVVIIKSVVSMIILPALLPLIIIGNIFNAIRWACNYGKK